jgi:hypothetical protein
MKQYTALLFSLKKASILLVALVVGGTFSMILAAPTHAYAESSLLFGQKHAYTAVVRADKRVVTYAKIYLTNADSHELSKTSFSLPDGVKVSNLSVYQITLPERCKTETTTKSTTESYDPSAPLSCTTLESQVFNFDSDGYYGYYSYPQPDSQLTYKQIPTNDQTGSVYSLALPDPIKSQKQGAYLVSYIADEGYVTGNFGLYGLQFKTLKVPDSIQEVRVSVDVSEDLYTQAKRSSITSASSSLDTLSSGATSVKDGVQNKSIDMLQSNIGTGGVFTKTGKSLAPNEVFVDNGQFADAAWKLNLWWIVGSIVGLIVLTCLIVVLMRKAQGQPILTKRGKTNGKR